MSEYRVRPAVGGPADVVLHSGAIYTVDAARRWAQAVAIQDGRLVAVGADDEVRPLVGPATEVIDLAGRLVVPGFQDAHIHAVKGGLNRIQCDLSALATPADYLAAIGEYVRRREVEWVVGGGWSMPAFPGGTPTAAVLDEIVADRPVFLRNADGHGAWVNSRALERAGIDRSTPDPSGGRIERDDEGHPTGMLHEGAMALVARAAPPASTTDLVEALRVAQAELHRLGVTGWQDATVGPGSEGFPDVLPAYLEVAEQGGLTARVVGALWWDRSRGLDQVDDLLAMRARAQVGRFRATTVKIMQDGVCETYTAAMLDPYVDPSGERDLGRGLSFVDPELLTDAIARLDAAGLQVHAHAIGDRAVREVLDAFEHTRGANGWTDNRHHIAHVQVVHPDDVPRFRRLGIAANAQPLWAMHEPQMDELTIPFLGPERTTWQYPWASLHASGAVLAFGSDWPVSSPDPFEQLHVAVNRRAWPGSPDQRDGAPVFLPHQRLTLPVALAAFTMGSAYVNHLDDRTGSIEVGKDADLVVVDHNLFAETPDSIADARAVMTMVGGEVVHADPDL